MPIKNTPSKKFREIAEQSVRDEVTNYFPDMNFCYRLRQHGPAVDVATMTADHHLSIDDVQDPCGGDEREKWTDSRKRRRNSVVEDLLREAGTHIVGRPRDATAVADLTSPRSPSCGRFVGIRTRRKAQRSRISSSTTLIDRGTGSKDHYSVRCASCETKILFLEKCRVLKGYHTLWAESRAAISVEPTEQVIGGDREDKSRTKGSKGGRRTKTTKEAPSPSSTSSTMELTFHSLHIVSENVVTDKHETSFALQSVFQPSRFLSLECYPRQMLHFSLICYALWHQKDGTAASEAPLCPSSSSSSTPAGASRVGELAGGHKEQPVIAPLSSPTTAAAAATATTGSAPCLTNVQLPSVDGDAVLILGLGGNVMGRCLDTILLPAVRLDVVEVEPTVVDACVAHGQVPPLTAWVPLEPSSASAATSAAPLQCAFPCHGGARGLRYRFVLGDAHRFLAEGMPSTTAAASGRLSSALNMNRLQYNMIYLDCYDPEREAMLCGAGLVELCHARLKPGGCLVINAHLLPRREHLLAILGAAPTDEKDSQTRTTTATQRKQTPFATVQALRVSGCDQSIIVCIARDAATESEAEEAEAEEKNMEKVNRFTLAAARTMATQINRCGLLHRGHAGEQKQEEGGGSSNSTSSSGVSSEVFFLDTNWLRRNSKLPPKLSSSSSALSLPDCRVWEHY